MEEIYVSPEIGFDAEKLQTFLKEKFAESGQIPQVVRRSIDARHRPVRVRLAISREEVKGLSWSKDALPVVDSAPEVVVVGAGPAGLFAAIECIELGLRPIVLERGKDVQARRRDIAAINKEHIVNPDSNYCFGEGGAGTYSDGKLYTRSNKRGDINKVLEILVDHGATTDILLDAHPHIGTNKLPKIIASMRETIIARGGQVLFGKRVTGFLIEGGKCLGVELSAGEKIKGKAVLLATGHSARDIFEILNQSKVLIEAKPFALGVRIEHPQELIDQRQYHCDSRGDYLPAASYTLKSQARQKGGGTKGVFSFCMCPGGFIVPSATNEGEVVVNGMSPSRRDSRFANSGIVVSLDESDYGVGPLAALQFQSKIEQLACEVAGGTQAAPAQRVADFVKGKASSTLPDCSYQPGLKSASLRDVLPEAVSRSLRQGVVDFEKKIKGYNSLEGLMVGIESRTSSPVRIPRDRDTGEHPTISGLFPCGEGAGYAGGIVSAAMDGQFQIVNIAKVVKA